MRMTCNYAGPALSLRMTRNYWRACVPNSESLQVFAQPVPKPRRVDVSQLIGAAREIILMHQGEEYRLRITSNRKLILTK